MLHRTLGLVLQVIIEFKLLIVALWDEWLVYQVGKSYKQCATDYTFTADLFFNEPNVLNQFWKMKGGMKIILTHAATDIEPLGLPCLTVDIQLKIY